MTPHDTCYKLLFSHPRMIRDLVTGFIAEDWVTRLDLASLEKVNGSYVTGSARERCSDMVWRVRWGDCWVYVYLLLEFQSSVDRLMAVRMMSYVGLLYQDLSRQAQIAPGKPLPPVVPIVLYNGDGRWTAPVDIADLLERVSGGPDRYRPALRYLLIDEGRIVDDPAWTVRSRNVVDALFRLEHNRDEEDVLAVLQRLSEWLRVDEQSSLQDAFIVWIRQVLLPRHAPDLTEDELERLRAQPMGLEGVCTMLSNQDRHASTASKQLLNLHYSASE